MHANNAGRRTAPQMWASRLLCSVLFLLPLQASSHNSAGPPKPKPSASDPVLGDRIVAGLVFGDKLWLRGTMISRDDPTGGLVSLSLADNSQEVHFDRGVLSLHVCGDELWVLRSLSLHGREVALSVLRNNTFQDLAKFEAPIEDDPVALLGSSGVPVVLSAEDIRRFSPDTKSWQITKLSGKLRSGVQISLATTGRGDATYIGINSGEWGGGIQRIDLKSGLLENIERRDTEELCAGPLNSDCDPVTGVVADVTNDECVIAAIGLVHMGYSHGRLLRVCGNTVSVIVERMKPGDVGRWKNSEAFSGLAKGPNGSLWAVTWRGLYQFGPDGKEMKAYPLPVMKHVSGIYLNRDLPGAIIVRTDVNWAVSTSGYSSLVIATK